MIGRVKIEAIKPECALPSCRKRFKRKTSWHIYHSRRCKQIAWHLRAAQQLRNEQDADPNGGGRE